MYGLATVLGTIDARMLHKSTKAPCLLAQCMRKSKLTYASSGLEFLHELASCVCVAAAAIIARARAELCNVILTTVWDDHYCRPCEMSGASQPAPHY